MVAWLDEQVVAEVIGADLAGDVDTTSLGQFADAVRSWVEDRRPDLFVTVDGSAPGEDPRPPAHVRLAAAMLAFRCYRNRTIPADELGNDEALAAMLGIGKRRGLRFGGAAPVVTTP